MIIQFWLGAILLLIIASAVFVIPFLSSKKETINSTDRRNKLNRTLYDVRIAEIENDDAQGLIRDKETLIAELQHNLLDDIDEHQLAETSHRRKLLWLPGLIILIVGSITLYSVIGAYQEVNNWQNTLQRYPMLQDKLFNDRVSSPTEQELRDIMLGLRTQLASEPKDAEGWLLFSRLASVFNELELSLDAIKKAYDLAPASSDVALFYIQLKMQKGDEYSQQQAEQILQQLLVDEANNLQAWSMYAFIALEKENFTRAINGWEKMLALPDITEKQTQMISDSIRYAQTQLSLKQVKSEQVESGEETSVEKQTTTIDESGAPIYPVNISLSGELSLFDSGFIIVYAQSVTGPKMPIAAVKSVLTTLPTTIKISDSDAMIEGMKLSDQSEFIIKVRLSKTGDVMNSAGDLQGVSNVIKAGQLEAINIVINEKI